MDFPTCQDSCVQGSPAAVIDAPASAIFEEIADPSRQPAWDGNANLAEAAPGQRVHAVGEVFVMTTTKGNIRGNHVVEFEEGRRIAWRTLAPKPLHLLFTGRTWRYELEPVEGGTLVRREYPTAIGPVDLMIRDAGGAAIAVEVKRRGDIDGVEQLTRYLELLGRDPHLAPITGVFAAQEIKPQARVLAEDRGIRCVVLDYEDMKGTASGAPRLF